VGFCCLFVCGITPHLKPSSRRRKRRTKVERNNVIGSILPQFLQFAVIQGFCCLLSHYRGKSGKLRFSSLPLDQFFKLLCLERIHWSVRDGHSSLSLLCVFVGKRWPRPRSLSELRQGYVCGSSSKGRESQVVDSEQPIRPETLM